MLPIYKYEKIFEKGGQNHTHTLGSEAQGGGTSRGNLKQDETIHLMISEGQGTVSKCQFVLPTSIRSNLIQ